MPHKPKFINNTGKDFSSLIELASTFYPFAQEQLGFTEPVTILLMTDEENAANDLGKTAFYNPEESSIGLYTDHRHPKDILRSLAHELVHHMQNGAGMLDPSAALSPKYAQEDEHMREMEREAYEKGNMCFRDWEDEHKAEISKWELKESIRSELKKRLVEAEGEEGPTGRPPESVADRPDPKPSRFRRFASAVGDMASDVAQRGREFHQNQVGAQGATNAGTYLSPAPRDDKGKVDFKTSAMSAGWDRDEQGGITSGPKQPYFNAEEQQGGDSSPFMPPKLGEVVLTKDSDSESWADWVLSFGDEENIKKAFYTMVYDAILEDRDKPIKLPMNKKLEIAQFYTKKMYGEGGPGRSTPEPEAPPEAEVEGTIETEPSIEGSTMEIENDPSASIEDIEAAREADERDFADPFAGGLEESINLEDELKLRSIINEVFGKMKTKKPKILKEGTTASGAPMGDILLNYDRPDADVSGRDRSTRSITRAGSLQSDGTRRREVQVGDYASEYRDGSSRSWSIEQGEGDCASCTRDRDPALGWLHHMENFEDRDGNNIYADAANRYRRYMEGDVELNDDELGAYQNYETTFADAWYAEYRSNNDYHRERNARSYGFEGWDHFQQAGGADLFTVNADQIADASPWVQREDQPFLDAVGEHIGDWAERQEFGGGWSGVNDRRSRADAFGAAGDPRFDTTVNPNLQPWQAEQNMMMYGITPQYEDMPDGSRRVIAPTGDEVRSSLQGSHYDNSKWYQDINPLYHAGAAASLYDIPDIVPILGGNTFSELGSEVSDFNAGAVQIGGRVLANIGRPHYGATGAHITDEYEEWGGAGEARPGTMMDSNMAFMTNQYGADGERIEGAWRNIPGADAQAGRSMEVPSIYQAIGAYYGGKFLWSKAPGLSAGWTSGYGLGALRNLSTGLGIAAGGELAASALGAGTESQAFDFLDPGRSGYGGEGYYWWEDGFVYADEEDLSLMAQPGGWGPEDMPGGGSNEAVNPWEDPREARIARWRDRGGQSGQFMNDIRTAEYGVSLDALYRNQRTLEGVIANQLVGSGARTDVLGLDPTTAVPGSEGVPEIRPGTYGTEPIDIGTGSGAGETGIEALAVSPERGRIQGGYSPELLNSLHELAANRTSQGNYSLPTDSTGRAIEGLPHLRVVDEAGQETLIDPYSRPDAWWRELDRRRVENYASAVETTLRGTGADRTQSGLAGGYFRDLGYVLSGIPVGADVGAGEFQTRQEYLRSYFYDQEESHYQTLAQRNADAPEDQRLSEEDLRRLAQQKAVGDTTLRRVLTPYSEFEREGTFNPLGQWIGGVEGRESAAWDADVMVTQMLQDPSARDMVLEQGMGKVFQLAWDYGFSRNNPEYIETILPGARYAPVRQALAQMAYQKSANMTAQFNGEEVDGVALTEEQQAELRANPVATGRQDRISAIQWTQFGLDQSTGGPIDRWVNSGSMARQPDGTYVPAGSMATNIEMQRLGEALFAGAGDQPSGVIVGRGQNRRELTNAQAYDRAEIAHGRAIVEEGGAYIPRPQSTNPRNPREGRWFIPGARGALEGKVNVGQDGNFGYPFQNQALEDAYRAIGRGGTQQATRRRSTARDYIRVDRAAPAEYETIFGQGEEELRRGAASTGGDMTGRTSTPTPPAQPEGGFTNRPSALEERNKNEKSKKHKLLKENKTMTKKTKLTREQLETLVRKKLTETLNLKESIFAPNHYCIHHGGVHLNGKVHMAEAVNHNYDSKLGRVTHYDMKLQDGTILENVPAENIQVTNASLALEHGGHSMAKKEDDKLENPDKADLDDDGQLSSYEKTRGKAIEKAMSEGYGMSSDYSKNQPPMPANEMMSDRDYPQPTIPAKKEDSASWAKGHLDNMTQMAPAKRKMAGTTLRGGVPMTDPVNLGQDLEMNEGAADEQAKQAQRQVGDAAGIVGCG